MISTAFKFMKYDRPKSIGIIVGIVISIFLIGQQLGTLRYLTGLMSGLIVNSNSAKNDIWIIDDISGNVNAISRIDARIAQQVKSIEGVEESYGVVIANTTVTFDGSKSSPVNIIGSEGPNFIAGPNRAKVYLGDIGQLYQSDAVSAEFFNAKNLGVELSVNKTFEMNNKTAIIKVLTKNAQGFSGNFMYTNIGNARFYGNFPNDKLSIVIVKLKSGYDDAMVVNRINNSFYGVKAWRMEELKNSTLAEILITSNIGVSFGFR